MRTVESQITSVYPSQTNFVVEASFTWDHDITFERNGETVTLKAGQYLQVGRQSFRPGGTKISAQTSSDSYPVGLSVCKCATIEMYDIGWSNADYWSLYEGATAHLKAAITIDGIERMVDMGHFKVYEVETVHEVTTLTCYDAMKAADVLCPAVMQGEHEYMELWKLAAQQLGLTPGPMDYQHGLQYNGLATVDAQHTIRQVIEAIALACGGNAMLSGNTLFVRPITSAADVTLTQWINPVEVAKTPVESKPVQPKHVESTATTAPAKTSVSESKPVATAQSKPTTTTAAPAATAAAAAPAAKSGKTAGDVSSMKTAPSGHYTLQLSSSSNYDNLNNWAKKEKLDKYVVYETSRNGQPWYVLVSGIYASKDEAKRAVTSLPADVQAKNPWAKPLHQVQADLK